MKLDKETISNSTIDALEKALLELDEMKVKAAAVDEMMTAKELSPHMKYELKLQSARIHLDLDLAKEAIRGEMNRREAAENFKNAVRDAARQSTDISC